MNALSPSQLPNVLFWIYQNNTWIIRLLVDETITPATKILYYRLLDFCTYISLFEFEIDIKRGSAFIVAGGDAWWMNENDRLFMKDDLDFSSWSRDRHRALQRKNISNRGAQCALQFWIQWIYFHARETKKGRSIAKFFL